MRKKDRKRAIGYFLIAYTALGGASAALISINTGKPLAFGQGLYQIKACSQWVSVVPNSVNAYNNGTYYAQQISIQGLDALHCKGTNFTVAFYDSSTVALPLFNTVIASSTVTANNVVLQISKTPTSQGTAASLLNPSGTNIGLGDSYETLTYTQSTGAYTVSFAQPKALSNSISKITVQSASY
jgi:type 1 fimbria pilin